MNRVALLDFQMLLDQMDPILILLAVNVPALFVCQLRLLLIPKLTKIFLLLSSWSPGSPGVKAFGTFQLHLSLHQSKWIYLLAENDSMH